MSNDSPKRDPHASEQVSESHDSKRMSAKVSFPIVGLGASAGGLAAFEAFFRAIPRDPSVAMTFILVQHLAPDHTSILTELMRNYTHMKVYQVEDGMAVLPNCVYVMPPNHDMAILNGTLQLLHPTEPRGQRLPIDFFFTSLAHDQRQLAIGIILSGTGSDGSLGVRAIKDEGGMVMAQSPESTEFDGMPKNAIKTGAVDVTCDVGDMPAHLIAFASRAYGNLPRPFAKRTVEIENAIQKILLVLRARTGHDFSRYKPNTIDRRIERRMAVNQIEQVDDYLKKIQNNPTEIEALFHDMLVGVTSFFRDPEAFDRLEKLLFELIAEKSASGVPVRVWVAGCSSGEEAYSIAILLQERLEAVHGTFGATLGSQVFASDLDPRAITTARAGLYSKSISENVSPSRLARYFTIEPDIGEYRISKSIREMVVFSEHDVNKDPPFAKLDLISCRNLLIYFSSDLQRRLIPLFHFALNPKGILFLGSSEGIGEFGQLFAAIDRKAKLFRRLPDFEGMPRVSLPRSSASTFMRVEATATTEKHFPRANPPLRELAERTVLSLIAPAAAIVNDKGDILYLLGRTGKFLEPAAGETSVSNILKMAREGLRHPLTTSLHKVVKTQQTVRVFNLSVKTNGHFASVNLSVCPVNARTQNDGSTVVDDLYLILLNEADMAPSPTSSIEPPSDPSGNILGSTSYSQIVPRDSKALIESLNAQLQAKEEHLQSAFEELENANEELKSSNEEMQSVNEELQSTNEELETSKEELQSINEELATVNSELQHKVADQSRLNNDMKNLLAGSGIATIFVDQKLCILRFTPAMAQIINLIGSDVGRPVGHIVSNLIGYDRLVADAQLVLDTLESQEKRVQTTNGLWFQMRIRPYRTVENVIEGVVVTFVDITDLKRVEDSLEKANRQMRLAVVVRDSSDAITVHDLEGRMLAWNPSATRIYGWSEEESLQMNFRDLVPQPLQREFLANVARLSKSELLQPYATQRLTKSGEILNVCVTATALVDSYGVVYAIATTERLKAE